MTNNETKTRDLTFDIAKGILIIFVILGHAPRFPLLYQVIIYWFHMPAFFIVSGLFFKDKGSNLFNTFKEGFLKYYLPIWIYYFLEAFYFNRFSTKDILKNLYGGVKSTGSVYWFATVLFLTFLLYTLLKRKLNASHLFIAIIIFYILGHLESIYLIPEKYKNPVPWSANIVLMAIFYYYFGDKFKKEVKDVASYKWPILNLIFIALGSFLIFLQIKRGNTSYLYTLNMKDGKYLHFLFDIGIPLTMTFAVISISKILTYAPIIKDIISLIGRNTMAIMFLHVPLLEYFSPITNLSQQLVLVILVCLGVSYFYNTVCNAFRNNLNKPIIDKY